jgi:hypothetical protein
VNKALFLKRTLEIIPGGLSWSIIILLILLSFLHPLASAVVIIAFDFYWIIRTVYLTTLLVMAHQRLFRQRSQDWLARCLNLSADRGFGELFQVVIFPVYNEGLEVLRPSLAALSASHYPGEKIILVLAFEERNINAHDNALVLEKEFSARFDF